jgi:hypothetical protein
MKIYHINDRINNEFCDDTSNKLKDEYLLSELCNKIGDQ